MDVKKTLDALYELVRNFKEEESIENLYIYTSIQVIINRLRKKAEELEIRIDLFEEYSMYLLGHAENLAGLEDFGHPKSQYKAQAYGYIDRLRSYHCFNCE